MSSKKILVVGQTPPPYHGQAMMIKRFVDAEFDSIEVHHLRMAFSKEISDIGKFSFAKVFHLLSLIISTYKIYFSIRPEVLVYYPVGNRLVGVMRDSIFLFCTRWLFDNLVLYFRAAGLSKFIKKYNIYIRKILLFPMMKPELSILLTEGNPRDDILLRSQKNSFVPNGIEDVYDKWAHLKTRKTNNIFECVYIGMIKESKGVTDLVLAFKDLVKKNDENILLKIIGSFSSPEYESKLKRIISENELEDYVKFEGFLIGEDKWRNLLNCDVICFPTFFEKESFGNVILEAFMVSKPVIATNWRGVPNVIDHMENGIIVPVNKPTEISNAISYLVNNPKEKRELGKNARNKYLNNYTLNRHLSYLEEELNKL